VPGVSGQRGAAINAMELTLFDVTLEFLSTLITANDDTVHGGGLRGGRWALKLGRKSGTLRLVDVEYMPGIEVSGTISKLGTRKEHSVLRLSGRNTPHGVLRIGTKWIEGRLDGRRVRSKIPGASVATAAGYAQAAGRSELVRDVVKRLRELRQPLG
jgi:hypothetical protein